jgi:UTP--glucose-1-phosphate uridylyltransferase
MSRELVGDEPFAVILADDIIDAEVPCLKQMIEVYNETGCSVLATQVVEGKAISSYGVLDATPVPGKWNGRLFEVRNLVESRRLKTPRRTWRSLGDMSDAGNLRDAGVNLAGSRRRVAVD